MNELDQKARERVAQLEQELEFWRNYLAMNAQAQALLSTPVRDLPSREWAKESVGEPVDNMVLLSRAENARRTRVTDNPKPAVVVEAVLDILRNNGHPMSRRELHTTLGLRGLHVRGADPVKALGTMLWRAPEQLVQIEGYGYWPKDDPYPPAGYGLTRIER